MTSPPQLYIAWTEFQRRQVSMAEIAGFECHFLPLRYKGRSHLLRACHYAALFWRTLALLREQRPAVAWLQLPQMPLLWAALLHRAVVDRQMRVVADCHNAVFVPPWSRFPGGLALLPRADLTLVHNEAVQADAIALGLPPQRTRVLEDVPPTRAAEARRRADQEAPPPAFADRPRPWVLFAGSYGRDEPIAELLAAARASPGTFAITGRLRNAARHGHDVSQPPANVVLTDYLPLADFEALLVHCDLVLGLTRFDGIQLSVCNEALGFGKPLVLADTPLLRALFGSGACLVDASDGLAIAEGVDLAWRHRGEAAESAQALASARRDAWRDGPWQDCLRALARETEPAQAQSAA
jgi:glycosyltransferase involved in cell wall biosynthesis